MEMKSEEQRAGATKGQAIFLLASLIAAYIISFVDRQVLALLVAPIKAHLGIGDFQMGLLQGFAFSLCFCLAGLPIGLAVDKWERRLLVMGGILLWSVATVACGLSNSFLQLFLARMAVGIGEAVLTPAAYSMLTDAFKPQHVVRAINCFSMAGTLGVGMAFLAGGSAIQAIAAMKSLPWGLQPWQAAFLMVGMPGVLVAFLFIKVKEPRRGGVPPAETLSITGQLRYLWDRRARYLPLYLTSMLLATIAAGGFVWIPTHLIRAFGLTAPSAGYILGVLYLGTALTGTICGTALTEALQRRGYVDAPMRTVFLIAIAMLPLGLAPALGNLTATIVAFGALCFVQASFYGNLVATLQMLTPPRLRGINSAFFILVTNLGSLGIGAAVIGAISDTVFPGRTDGIGLSMACVNVICVSLALIVAGRSLPLLTAALKEQRG